MDHLNLLGYFIFAFITSITPGPINVLLFSHGKGNGFKNAGKLMLGILCGFFLLIYISGYGIAAIIVNKPFLLLAIKIVASVWFFYLAFELRRININSNMERASIKIGFFSGLTLQFVNPKAWLMGIGAASAFMPTYGNKYINPAILALCYCIFSLPSMLIWIGFGSYISLLLKSPKSAAVIGYGLFFLMMLSIVTIWVH